MRIGVPLPLSLALLVLAAVPAAQCELDKLRAGDPDAGDHFGSAVAVDGDVALIGAHDDDEGAPNGGAVYVFERTPAGWVETQKLIPSLPTPGIHFGAAVALEGNIAVVGAPGIPFQVPASEAWIFERTPGGWSEVTRLAPADLEASDEFGFSVAVSQNAVAIGSPGDDDSGNQSGAVRIYRKNQTGWKFEGKLIPTAPAINRHFGFAVDIEGSRVAVGAPDDYLGLNHDSRVYVFDKVGPWTLAAVLADATSASDVHLGYGRSLSLSGNRVLAPNASGSAILFEEQGGTWSQTELFPASPVFNYGWTTALAGDVALVGTRSFSPVQPGVVDAFRFQGGAWTHTAELHPLDGDTGVEAYGQALALDGDVAFVGSFGDGDGSPGSGSSWLYSVSDTDCPSLFGAPKLVSLATGGQQVLRLDAGDAHAGELFWLLGSASGTSPGLDLGGFTLPLVVDAYFVFGLANPSVLLSPSLGVFDAEGRALAAFSLPPGASPSLAGATLHHAWLALDLASDPPLALTATSAASALELVP
jgi:hypothetical protein